MSFSENQKTEANFTVLTGWFTLSEFVLSKVEGIEVDDFRTIQWIALVQNPRELVAKTQKLPTMA